MQWTSLPGGSAPEICSFGAARRLNGGGISMRVGASSHMPRPRYRPPFQSHRGGKTTPMGPYSFDVTVAPPVRVHRAWRGGGRGVPPFAQTFSVPCPYGGGLPAPKGCSRRWLPGHHRVATMRARGLTMGIIIIFEHPHPGGGRSRVDLIRAWPRFGSWPNFSKVAPTGPSDQPSRLHVSLSAWAALRGLARRPIPGGGTPFTLWMEESVGSREMRMGGRGTE